jgi:hypothetical protein
MMAIHFKSLPMSKIRFFFLSIACGILFSNCTKLVYTTDQYLGNFRTQKGVVTAFGLPTQQRQGQGITEWIYDYGSMGIGSTYSLGNANANVNSYGNSSYGNASGSISSVSVFSNFQRYVKFTFDNQGNATRYEYRGVDFSERKKARGKTVALIGIGLAVMAGLIILGVSAD